MMTIFDNIKLPKILLEVHSDFNGKIIVAEAGHTRKLIVDGVKQSINWDSPATAQKYWGRTVDVLKENQPALKKVLVLGLGGGTIQHLISHAFPGVEIVSIEIDPEIVKVAKEYFDVDKIPNHRIILEDAFRVIVEPESHELHEHYFDAIVIDIFAGEKFPDLGKSGNFIAALKKMAIPDGLIVFNRIYLQSHQDDVNLFIDSIQNFLTNVQSTVIAGATNSDNVLIYGRA
ncbi:MAG TPA: fused MFS/spermidine synthase [Candidatus Saccharimonadales bacterium]|nr:fused MFS/spermidine synthase [Candidatus Saccharimonadales bacterium]